MNELSYKEFENLLFTSLCHNLYINEKGFNFFLPKADSETVNKYKFYYEHEKAKEDFLKKKILPVLEKIFNEALKDYNEALKD